MEEEKIITEEYEGNKISFDVTYLSDHNTSWVNATEMARVIGSRGKFAINHFLRNKNTKEFIEALSNDTRIRVSDLVRVVKGGNSSLQGTWMHQNLAIEFARWLNPYFGIWCNKIIYNLIWNKYDVLKKTFEEQKQENEKIVKGLENTIDTLRENSRISNRFVNDYLNYTKDYYTTTDIAKSLIPSMSSKELLKALERKHIVYRDESRKHWYLYSCIDKLGNFTRLVNVKTKSGVRKNIRVWTPSGRYFIYSLLCEKS